MTTLLLAEHDGRALLETTARALRCAQALGNPVDILVAGRDCLEVARAAARLDGVARVLHADAEVLHHQLAEPMAALLVSLADDHDALVAPATPAGKGIMPRTAALLDVMQVSDVIAVVDSRTFQRPTYAGAVIETVRTTDPRTVITVRTSAFEPVGAGGDPAPITSVPVAISNELSEVAGDPLQASARPDLATARIVISGGRAFGSAERFWQHLEPVADKLGAAIGASRAAVDAGYAPNSIQVGQTGAVVAPDLYIACGISGAIQHLAGMKAAKVIVAINKDAEAPIFRIADYGLVGDVFELLPELEEALGPAEPSGS